MDLELLKIIGNIESNSDVNISNYIYIHKGRIQATNGVNVTVNVKCSIFKEQKKPLIVQKDLFIKAITVMQNKFKYDVKKSNLLISKNKLKVSVPIVDDEYVVVNKSGKSVSNTDKIFDTFARLLHFADIDNGFVIADEYCYATNNIVLAKMPISLKGNTFTLPYALIELITKINDDLKDVLIDKNKITFVFKNVWVSGVFTHDVNDKLKRFFKDKSKKLMEISDKLVSDVKLLDNFGDVQSDITIIRFDEKGIHTDYADMRGHSFKKGKFNSKILYSVLSNATHIDFLKYPEPVPFKGDNGLVGIMAGMTE